MIGIFIFGIFGVFVGWFTASFRDGRGGLGYAASVLVGVIGSFVGMMLFSIIGTLLWGDGPALLGTFIAAPLTAFLLVLLVGLIKK